MLKYFWHTFFQNHEKLLNLRKKTKLISPFDVCFSDYLLRMLTFTHVGKEIASLSTFSSIVFPFVPKEVGSHRAFHAQTHDCHVLEQFSVHCTTLPEFVCNSRTIHRGFWAVTANGETGAPFFSLWIWDLLLCCSLLIFFSIPAVHSLTALEIIWLQPSLQKGTI